MPVRGQRKPQLQLLRRIVVMIPSNYAWRVVVSVHSSKESERFSSVEAVCGHAPMHNLPQTIPGGGANQWGRKRSKRRYAADVLVAREHTTIGARASKEVDRVGHTNRLQHSGGSIEPPRPCAMILIVLQMKRSRSTSTRSSTSQLFLSVRFAFGGATALTETNRDHMIPMRGRERSKRGRTLDTL